MLKITRKIILRKIKVVLETEIGKVLILSWNMADFLMPKFRERGYKGKFILPVPSVEVIE